MAPRSARVYVFGEFRLDVGKRLLFGRDAALVSLTPKVYDTLAYLLEHAGTVVSKDELMRALWPDTAVEENNLTQNISALRRALGEGHADHHYIATVPGRGYQFVATVTSGSDDGVQGKPAGTQSIAVLPFLNVSGDPNFEYFTDGLTEELINALSKVERVRVVARTSAFSFKERRVDIREIASKLGVDLVLEGSLRRSGDRLRITAQLINAIDGYHLWAERYQREANLRDLFEVQDEITLAIVDALKLKLTGGERAGVLKHHTDNVEAHELYLKGRFYLFRMTRSGIRSGMTYLEQAIQADPSDAHAHVGLAHAYRMYALTLEMSPSEVRSKALAAAERAIELDAGLAEAHAVLGFNVFWFEWAWNTAERHFRRALELNQKSADAHWMYAHLCSNIGRHDEALTRIARARELDPLSGLINALEGQLILHAGRTDEAIARLQEALALDPSSRVTHLFAASAYVEKGLMLEAAAEARASGALCPGGTQASAFEVYADVKLGRHAEARATLDQVLSLSRERWVPPYHVALIYNSLDEPDNAFIWLERGFEERDPKMAFLKVEPKWKKLHGDPRFAKLLKGMNLL